MYTVSTTDAALALSAYVKVLTWAGLASSMPFDVFLSAGEATSSAEGGRADGLHKTGSEVALTVSYAPR